MTTGSGIITPLSTTARSGMSDLITTLRGMVNAGTADYTVGGITYWSDIQLQTALDRYASQVVDEPLQAVPEMTTGGAITYTEYRSKGRFFETTVSGTSRFVIKDSTGAVVSSGWSADYEKGVITFTADTLGVSYYLSGTTYDIYAAASDVWYQKAGHAAEMIDFSTGGHNIKRSHITQLALTMARRYENMASTLVNSSPVEMVRGDMA